MWESKISKLVRQYKSINNDNYYSLIKNSPKLGFVLSFFSTKPSVHHILYSQAGSIASGVGLVCV